MNVTKSTVVQDVVLDIIPPPRQYLASDVANFASVYVSQDADQYISYLLTQLAELRAASEWVEISKEGLPEAMKDVQVGAEGLSVRPMFYSGTNHANSASGELEPLWICCITGKKYTWPTHWQPLPPAPQPSPASAVKGE